MSNSTQAQKPAEAEGISHLGERANLVALLSLVLFICVFIGFFPCLRCGFVNYDDPVYVTSNPAVQQGLSWSNVRWAFTSTGGTGNWHPLTWISHMLDCEIYGLQPWGHHLTNLALHACNAVLVFLLLRRSSRLIWQSLAVAALFGLHPTHVESVAWISERKDVLSTFFWLLSIFAYVCYGTEKRRPAKVLYGASVFCFALALLAKPMPVTGPILLLLLDFWPLHRLNLSVIRSRLVEKTPFLLLSTVASVAAFLAQRSAGAISMLPELPLLARFENAIVSYVRYLAELLWPLNLVVFYPHPGRWPVAVLLSSAFVLVAVSIFAWMNRLKRPYLSFGWIWFLVTLAPVIGLVQVGAQAMADRYTYVPSIGIFLVLVWAIYELLRHWMCTRQLSVVLGTTGVLACAILTLHQLRYWQDSISLFTHATALTKNNWRALNNLGTALLEQGKLKEAHDSLEQALRINPEEPGIHNNLGAVLMRERHFDEAIRELQTGLSSRPEDVQTRVNLGAIFISKGEFSAAIADLKQAIIFAPTNSSARDMLGTALLGAGRFHEAIEQYRAALTFKTNDPVIMNNVGVALMRAGRLEEACVQFEAVLLSHPQSAQVCRNLGEAMARRGRSEDALADYQKAVQFEPNNAEGHFQLAVLLLRFNRRSEAAIQLEQACKLNPRYGEQLESLR